MSRPTMNRLLLGAALAAAAGLTACDEPQTQPMEAPAVEDAAPAAEDAAAPVVAESAPEPTPASPVETLPPDQRSSEQTVEPESDTLFY